VHYGFGGHERSGQGYELLAERRKELDLGPEFIWLADIQEGVQEALYLDGMHYTAPFSRTIANHIVNALIERKLLITQSPSRHE
jgi:hypothetical protein